MTTKNWQQFLKKIILWETENRLCIFQIAISAQIVSSYKRCRIKPSCLRLPDVEMITGKSNYPERYNEQFPVAVDSVRGLDWLDQYVLLLYFKTSKKNIFELMQAVLNKLFNTRLTHQECKQQVDSPLHSRPHSILWKLRECEFECRDESTWSKLECEYYEADLVRKMKPIRLEKTFNSNLIELYNSYSFNHSLKQIFLRICQWFH